MKKISFLVLLLSALSGSMVVACEDTDPCPSGVLGVLSIDVTVNQNLSNIDNRILEKLKVSALERFFEPSERWRIKAAFLSYQRDEYRVDTDRNYFVQQIQLASAEISSITPLPHGFVMTITAHFGLGITPEKWVDSQELILTDAEFEKFKTARDCPTCVREGVERGGQLPVEAGINIRINYKNSYIHMLGEFQRSGNYRRLLDESGAQYSNYGYRMIFDWERRNVSKFGVEIGQDLKWKKTTFTAFARVQNTHFASTADIAEQGDIQGGGSSFGNIETIRRDPLKLTTLEVGIRVKLGPILKSR